MVNRARESEIERERQTDKHTGRYVGQANKTGYRIERETERDAGREAYIKGKRLACTQDYLSKSESHFYCYLFQNNFYFQIHTLNNLIDRNLISFIQQPELDLTSDLSKKKQHRATITVTSCRLVSSVEGQPDIFG